jgi:ribonuclease BN (tRNA processing enzyme)
MELNFLGSGSAFNPGLGNTSAYFVEGGRLFLLDCGETVFSLVRDLPAYRACGEVFVLLTHLHADHVGSLGSLISYSRYVAGKKVVVLHPLDSAARLLDLLGIERPWYEFRNPPPGTAADLGGGITVTGIEVDHVPALRCFGYLISAGGRAIWYSGDARRIPAGILAGFTEGSIELIYQDSGGGNGEDLAHAGIVYLEAVIPPLLRSRVVCMHLDEAGGELLAAKGFGVAGAS